MGQVLARVQARKKHKHARRSDSPRMSSIDFFEAADMPYNISNSAADYTSTPRRAIRLWFGKLWLPQNALMIVFLLALGVCTSGTALLINLSIDNLIKLKVLLASSTPWFLLNYLLWILYSIAFALISAVLITHVSPLAQGAGVPEVKSVLSGVVLHNFLSLKTFVARSLSLIFAVVAGFSLGKEGPFIHIASMIAKNLCRLRPFKPLWQSEMLRSQILAAGCAAGVSATFGTPVGGVLFSIEVTATYYLVQNYWRGFFCAVCGSLMLHLVGGSSELKLFTTNFTPGSYSDWELIPYAIVGVLSGIIGALWVETVMYFGYTRQNLEALKKRRYVQVVVIVILSALIAFPCDIIRNGSKAAISGLFNDHAGESTWNWDLPHVYINIIIFVCYSFFFTAVSCGLPVGAGIFAPVTAMGAAFGRMIGETMKIMFPAANIIPGGYAVVGAAAMASGVTRTLSTAVIVFELTGQLKHMLPVLVSVLLATAVGNLFNDNIFDSLMKLKKLPYLPPLKSGSYKVAAKDIMQKPALIVTQDITFAELLTALQAHTPSEVAIPVVRDLESMQLIGTVQRAHLEKLLDHLGYSSERYLTASTPIVTRSFALRDEPLPSSMIAVPSDAHQPNGSTNSELEVVPPPTPIRTPQRPTFRSATEGVLNRSEFLDAPIDLLNSCPVERAPMQLPGLTAVTRMHLLFVMFGLKQVLIVDSGKLVGIVNRTDLMENR